MAALQGKNHDSLPRDDLSLVSQKTQWSLTEKQAFPGLLQHYGRNFSRIADHIKTKSADELEQYFAHLLEVGRTDISDIADIADAQLQPKLINRAPQLNSREDEIRDGVSIADHHPTFYHPNPTIEGEKSNISHLQGLSTYPSDLVGEIKESRQSLISNNAREAKKTPYKRTPRPREKCPYCDCELHDGAVKNTLRVLMHPPGQYGSAKTIL